MNSQKKYKAGVVEGSGFTGGELLKLLLNHPEVSLSFVHSYIHLGKPISSVHPDLSGKKDLAFSNDLDQEMDVLFISMGRGEAKKFLEENAISPEVRIIDLSEDFRLLKNKNWKDRKFIYGLPELHREKIRKARSIVNPGCFATGIQLGLLPLAKAGLLKEEIYTTGITGSTGAEQTLSTTPDFSRRASNIQAYKTLAYQHMKEINQSMALIKAPDTIINFVPWRGDFTRGIFISSMLTCDWREEDLVEIFQEYYKDHPFTLVSQSEIFLKQVINTNTCVIQLEKVGTKLVVHSALDNLLKGASGQAVQNMNLMLNLEETAGLHLKATAY